jgi:hypothetical protein
MKGYGFGVDDVVLMMMMYFFSFGSQTIPHCFETFQVI